MRIDFYYFLYPELFPNGTEPEDYGAVPRYLGEYHGGFAGNGDAVLLLFVHSTVLRPFHCSWDLPVPAFPWALLFLF